MDKKITRTSSFNKASKITLIIIFAVPILLFLYLVTSLFLQSNHKNSVFGNNLPVTNSNKIVVVIDLTDLEGEKVNATLSAILIPAGSFCIKSVLFQALISPNLHDTSYLYNEKSYGRTELDPTIFQKPIYFVSSADIPSSFPGGFIFVNAICASESPQIVGYYDIKENLPELKEPSIVVDTKTSDFYYPFDKRKLLLSIFVETDADRFNVKPEVVGEVHPLDWEAHPSIIISHEYASIEVEYLRPIFVRYLVVVLLILLFSLIVVSVFIKDHSNYVGILLGALLGLSGLRPILKPIELTGNTMIDLFFMSLYILLGISFYIHFVSLPLWYFTEKTNFIKPKKTGNGRKKPSK